jgi:cell division protein ZapA
MSASDKKYLNINLVIADRPYPLKISPEEEENVRQAARAINKKVKEYQRQYDAKDKQDYLAMCALSFAVEALGHQQEGVEQDDTLAEKLHKLDALLSEANNK